MEDDEILKEVEMMKALKAKQEKATRKLTWLEEQERILSLEKKWDKEKCLEDLMQAFFQNMMLQNEIRDLKLRIKVLEEFVVKLMPEGQKIFG